MGESLTSTKPQDNLNKFESENIFDGKKGTWGSRDVNSKVRTQESKGLTKTIQKKRHRFFCNHCKQEFSARMTVRRGNRQKLTNHRCAPWVKRIQFSVGVRHRSCKTCPSNIGCI